MPWCALVGLKWPPAVVNAGPSHFAAAWIWMACSPGGRPLRSSAIFTPLPPGPSEILAVPTSFPVPSFTATVTGLLAAKSAALNNHVAAAAITRLFIGSILVEIETSYAPPLYAHVFAAPAIVLQRCEQSNWANRAGANKRIERDAANRVTDTTGFAIGRAGASNSHTELQGNGADSADDDSALSGSLSELTLASPATAARDPHRRRATRVAATGESAATAAPRRLHRRHYHRRSHRCRSQSRK